MATFMVLFVVASLLLLMIPVSMGYIKHRDLHHVDTMAGDEGED